MKMTVEEIKQRKRVVCICRAISMGKVRDAIEKGALTLEAVNAASGCGRGDCGGTRCGPVIVEELERLAKKRELDGA